MQKLGAAWGLTGGLPCTLSAHVSCPPRVLMEANSNSNSEAYNVMYSVLGAVYYHIIKYLRFYYLGIAIGLCAQLLVSLLKLSYR